MKTLNSFSPIFIQVLILIAGFIMINTGLANENNMLNTNSNLTILENELELTTEDWMTDLSFWKIEKKGSKESEKTAENNTTQSLLNENVFEEEIAIEEWMEDANNDFWNKNSKILQVDNEDEIVLEDWMTSPEKWNN